jgi:hypothetical protein
MLDLDPRLDARLRSFYEHIEQQAPTRDVGEFVAVPVRPRRRTLPLLAGVAGVAVVAAGIGLFVTELSGHHAVKPPAPASHSPGQRTSLPSASQLTLGIPSISHTVIGVTHGHGTATLPTFTPQGMIFIELSCAGSTGFNLYSPNHAVGLSGGCDGSPSPSLAGFFVPANASLTGRPLTLTMTADSSTIWEIVVADVGPIPPLPTLGGSSLPAGAHVLVPVTYGVGTSQLETFVPSGPYFVEYACAGSGTINFTTFDGPASWVSAECAHGAVGMQETAKPASPGPINFTVKTMPPRTLWEVMVFEVTAPKS